MRVAAVASGPRWPWQVEGHRPVAFWGPAQGLGAKSALACMLRAVHLPLVGFMLMGTWHSSAPFPPGAGGQGACGWSFLCAGALGLSTLKQGVQPAACSSAQACLQLCSSWSSPSG